MNLLLPLRRKEPIEGCSEALLVEPRRIVEGALRPRGQLTGDQLLLLPVAVEIQQPGTQLQRMATLSAGAPFDQGAGLARRQPLLGIGPWQRRRLEVFWLSELSRRGVLVGFRNDLRGRRRKVQAHRAEPRGPNGQRRRQQHALVRLPAEMRQPPGDVDVSRVQHPRILELPQKPCSFSGFSWIEPIDDGRHRGTRPSSSASDSSVTRAAGGLHANTPHGCPSMTGVSGPHMPRR